MSPDFDCLIIGGGMVGASLACALRDLPLKIGVVEAIPMSLNSQPSYDDRGLGIAPSSQRILQGIGLWENLTQQATPIKNIHVSDRGHFGFTRISAEKSGLSELGHIVVGRSLGQCLLETIKHSPTIEWICPAKVEFAETHEEYASVEIQQAEESTRRKVTTRLLVIADGGNSKVRDLLGVKTESKNYDQTAIVTNVTPEHPHNNTAYERFTSTGPLALLPTTEQRCVSVWTVRSDQADQIMNLNEEQFLKQLGDRFGRRLGHFTKMGQRRGYPMKLIRALQITGARFAVLGNAAHAIHPNAAQGLNLGLRDVAHLAELIADAVRTAQDPGSPKLLSTYSQLREEDHHQVINFSDGLTRLFYNENPALIAFRNLSMLVVDHFPPIKRSLVRRAMGLSGNASRLVRGGEL